MPDSWDPTPIQGELARLRDLALSAYDSGHPPIFKRVIAAWPALSEPRRLAQRLAYRRVPTHSVQGMRAPYYYLDEHDSSL